MYSTYPYTPPPMLSINQLHSSFLTRLTCRVVQWTYIVLGVVCTTMAILFIINIYCTLYFTAVSTKEREGRKREWGCSNTGDHPHQVLHCPCVIHIFVSRPWAANSRFDRVMVKKKIGKEPILITRIKISLKKKKYFTQLTEHTLLSISTHFFLCLFWGHCRPFPPPKKKVL
jgi:hypothetical protein